MDSLEQPDMRCKEVVITVDDSTAVPTLRQVVLTGGHMNHMIRFVIDSLLVMMFMPIAPCQTRFCWMHFRIK